MKLFCNCWCHRIFGTCEWRSISVLRCGVSAHDVVPRCSVTQLSPPTNDSSPHFNDNHIYFFLIAYHSCFSQFYHQGIAGYGTSNITSPTGLASKQNYSQLQRDIITPHVYGSNLYIPASPQTRQKSPKQQSVVIGTSLSTRYSARKVVLYQVALKEIAHPHTD